MRLLACLTAIACLAAADPAPAAGSSSITVTSIRLSREINLAAGTDTGVSATQTQTVQVVLSPKPDPALRLTGEVRVVVDKAVTDAGEDLVLPPVAMDADLRRMMARRPQGYMRQGMMNPEFVKLKYPAKPAKTLSLGGSLTLVCEAKPGESIDLDLSGAAPALELPGMRLTVPAIQQPGKFAFTYTTTGAEAKVREYQLIAADGSVLETPGRSSSSDGRKMDCTYSLKDQNAKPAKLRVIMLGEQVEVRVPFSFTALPLDAPIVDEAASRPMRRPMSAQPPVEPAPAPTPPVPGKSDF
jgi:hypothetical protein